MKKLSERLRELKRRYWADADDMEQSPHERSRLGHVADGLEEAARLAEEHEAATGWRPVTEAPLDAWVTAGKYTAAGEWITISIIRPSDTPTPRMGLTHFILHPPPPEREP